MKAVAIYEDPVILLQYDEALIKMQRLSQLPISLEILLAAFGLYLLVINFPNIL